MGGGWHLKVRGSETLLASIILLESESSNPHRFGGQERNSWIRPPCSVSENLTKGVPPNVPSLSIPSIDGSGER